LTELCLTTYPFQFLHTRNGDDTLPILRHLFQNTLTSFTQIFNHTAQSHTGQTTVPARFKCSGRSVQLGVSKWTMATNDHCSWIQQSDDTRQSKLRKACCVSEKQDNHE